MSIHKSAISPIVIPNEIPTGLDKIGRVVSQIVAEMRRSKTERELSQKTAIHCIRITMDEDVNLDSVIADIKAVGNCAEVDIVRGDEFSVKVEL